MTTIKDWCESLQHTLTERKEKFDVAVADELTVAYGWEDDCNKKYCEEHNILCLDRKGDGGTIVFEKGNIGVAFIYNNQKYKRWMLVKFLDDLCEYFINKELNATRSRNDILIDNFKVISASSYNLPPDYKWSYETIQISINSNLETIQNVCLKEMVKMPRPLSYYNITTEEMLDFIDKWKEENIYE